VGAYIVRRLVFVLLVLLGVTILTFFLARVVPADPARLLAGPRASPEAVEQVREARGLDRPLWEQYRSYMGGLLRGDLGTSLVTRRAVTSDLATFAPATLELILYSLLVGSLLGVALGMSSAIRPGSAIDVGGRFVAIGGLSVPNFWVALLLQFAFFSLFGLLPFGGRLATGVLPPPGVTGLYTVDSLLAGRLDLFAQAVSHLILPVTALALAEMGLVARIVRASMLEVLGRDYIRTARAKGLRPWRIYRRHALRNALLPVVTIIGLELGLLLSGTVLVESIFAWPGLGRYMAEAIASSDYNAIMGVTIVVTVGVVLLNLIVDLVYAHLDPRVRLA
jgi:ABC-type dipeptide/oligopeptide/nickel transport system permease component